MALIDLLRPDYPKTQTDSTGVRRTYVMRGLKTVIDPLKVGIGSMFQGYPVDRTSEDAISTSGWIDYTVETYYTFPQATSQVDDDQYPFYEIDQVQIEKSLKQHPAFASFVAADWQAVNAWDNEMDMALKAAYQYYLRDKENSPVGSVQTLTGTTTTGQKAYAALRLRGVESFLDFAPVVRRTTKYRGNSAPSSADAGQKTSAPSYAPAGYEWLKTADRVSKQGVKSIEWIRQEEWTGARKVLLDKDEIFS